MWKSMKHHGYWRLEVFHDSPDPSPMMMRWQNAGLARKLRDNCQAGNAKEQAGVSMGRTPLSLPPTGFWDCLLLPRPTCPKVVDSSTPSYSGAGAPGPPWSRSGGIRKRERETQVEKSTIAGRPCLCETELGWEKYTLPSSSTSICSSTNKARYLDTLPTWTARHRPSCGSRGGGGTDEGTRGRLSNN